MITIDYELQDMIISALRYAIGRRTYITEETCNFIKNHPEIVNKRVKMVMLIDLKDIKNYYKESDTDYPLFKSLESWLENFEVEDER